MNKNIVSESSKNHPAESIGEMAREAVDTAKDAGKMAARTAGDAAGVIADAAGHATEVAKNAAQCCAEKTRDLYQSAVDKTEHTMTASKDCVRRNPVLFVLGAVAFGAAITSVVMMARRRPTFAERYESEPMGAIRDAILAAISPVTHRVHQGYDSARDGAGKAMERMQCLGSKRCCNSISDRIGRIGNKFKIW